MDWPRILAYITGTVDQELLLRNEYLVAENRILRDQVNGRLLLSDCEKKTLAEIGYRLGRKALEDVANARMVKEFKPLETARVSEPDRGAYLAL
jgi:putative transposase